MPNFYTRSFPGAKFERRERQDGSGLPKIVGYFSVFNEVYNLDGWLAEVILPGAWTESLAGKYRDDIKAFGSHGGGGRGYDHMKTLGSTKSGTLSLKEDDKGLWGEIDPPDTNEGRDTVTLLERGDIDSASIGFFDVEVRWKPGAEFDILEVVKGDLMEVSPVPYGANKGAEIGIRSSLRNKGLKEEEKKVLCRAFNRLENREQLELTNDDKQALIQYRSVLFSSLSEERQRLLSSEVRNGFISPAAVLHYVDTIEQTL